MNDFTPNPDAPLFFATVTTDTPEELQVKYPGIRILSYFSYPSGVYGISYAANKSIYWDDDECLDEDGFPYDLVPDSPLLQKLIDLFNQEDQTPHFPITLTFRGVELKAEITHKASQLVSTCDGMEATPSCEGCFFRMWDEEAQEEILTCEGDFTRCGDYPQPIIWTSPRRLPVEVLNPVHGEGRPQNLWLAAVECGDKPQKGFSPCDKCAIRTSAALECEDLPDCLPSEWNGYRSIFWMNLKK